MINLSEFTPEVVAYAPGCPAFIAERAILSAAIEFAEKSWCLNEEHDPFDLDAGEAKYELDAPDLCRVVGIMNLRIDGEQIDAISESELSRVTVDWRTATSPLPTHYISTGAIIRVYPIPVADVDDVVTARIAYAPERDATRVDDRFRDYYSDAIVHGAAARLVLQPGKEWAAPPLGEVYQHRFMQDVYSARNVTMREIMQARPNSPGL